MPNSIVKSQFVQDETDHIVVRLVCDGEFTEDQRTVLVNEMKHKFGNDLRVDFKLVDDIPREKSGKYKLIVNNVMGVRTKTWTYKSGGSPCIPTRNE
jgi:phenylacetate-CoA ligase